MSKPKVQIVIPVYNSAKYLRRCLDSLLGQTYQYWEAIMVNDASKDNSVEIMKEYQAKDDRIVVYNFEENHGAVVRILEKIPIWARHLYFKMVLGILSLHGEKSKYVLSADRHNLITKKDLIIGEPKELEFEDGVFPVVSDYDTYLTMKYGDWKAELSQDQQRGHDLTLGDIEWEI